MKMQKHKDVTRKVSSLKLLSAMLILFPTQFHPVHSEVSGFVNDGYKWEKATLDNHLRVKVCWEDDVSKYSLEKSYVKNAVEGNWEFYVDLDFDFYQATEWPCLTPTGNRIYLKFYEDDAARSHTRTLGKNLQGMPNGVIIYLRTDPARRTMDNLTYTALHEFGHVLGIAHEQNRDFKDKQEAERLLGVPATSCMVDKAPETPPVFGNKTIDIFDFYSVMNYPCKSEDELRRFPLIKLSCGDIAAGRFLYGINMANFNPSKENCVAKKVQDFSQFSVPGTANDYQTTDPNINTTIPTRPATPMVNVQYNGTQVLDIIPTSVQKADKIVPGYNIRFKTSSLQQIIYSIIPNFVPTIAQQKEGQRLLYCRKCPSAQPIVTMKLTIPPGQTGSIWFPAGDGSFSNGAFTNMFHNFVVVFDGIDWANNQALSKSINLPWEGYLATAINLNSDFDPFSATLREITNGAFQSGTILVDGAGYNRYKAQVNWKGGNNIDNKTTKFSIYYGTDQDPVKNGKEVKVGYYNPPCAYGKCDVQACDQNYDCTANIVGLSLGANYFWQVKSDDNLSTRLSPVYTFTFNSSEVIAFQSNQPLEVPRYQNVSPVQITGTVELKDFASANVSIAQGHTGYIGDRFRVIVHPDGIRVQTVCEQLAITLNQIPNGVDYLDNILVEPIISFLDYDLYIRKANGTDVIRNIGTYESNWAESDRSQHGIIPLSHYMAVGDKLTKLMVRQSGRCQINPTTGAVIEVATEARFSRVIFSKRNPWEFKTKGIESSFPSYTTGQGEFPKVDVTEGEKMILPFSVDAGIHRNTITIDNASLAKGIQYYDNKKVLLFTPTRAQVGIHEVTVTLSSIPAYKTETYKFYIEVHRKIRKSLPWMVSLLLTE
jgi:hypothetical protein